MCSGRLHIAGKCGSLIFHTSFVCSVLDLSTYCMAHRLTLTIEMQTSQLFV